MSSRTEITIEKAQTLWENGMASLTPLPQPDKYGNITMNYQELRRLIKQRSLLSYSDGICYAFAAFDIDEKRRKRKQ